MATYQHLPPAPDPDTGEPRPPSAIPIQGIVTPGGKRERKLSRVKIPDPPPDWGPVLEWWQGPRAARRGAFIFATAVLAAFVTWQWGGIGWTATWWMWLALPALASPFLLIDRHPIAAGGHWLYFQGVWVNTYRLTSVWLTRSYPSYALVLEEASPVISRGFGPHTLRLWATWLLTLGEYAPKDRTLTVNAQLLQENPKLWALVYNGIRHSVNNGAECDQDTRRLLGLDIWPDIDIWSTPPIGSTEELRQAEQSIDDHADPEFAEEFKRILRRNYSERQ